MCLWLDHLSIAQGKYKNWHLLCIYEVINFKKLDFIWFLVSEVEGGESLDSGDFPSLYEAYRFLS